MIKQKLFGPLHSCIYAYFCHLHRNYLYRIIDFEYFYSAYYIIMYIKRQVLLYLIFNVTNVIVIGIRLSCNLYLYCEEKLSQIIKRVY